MASVPTGRPVTPLRQRKAGFGVAIGRAHSRAVEASLTGTLPLGLRGVLNCAYMDAMVSRNGIDPNSGFALREGDPLINILRHSASAILWPFSRSQATRPPSASLPTMSAAASGRPAFSSSTAACSFCRPMR